MQLHLWRKTIAKRLILIEAGFWLLTSRFLLAFMPFPRLMQLLAHPPRRPATQATIRARHRQQVRQAIYLLRRRFGKQTTCLHRAIAAQMMLQRRGVSTTLYFGAIRQPQQGLTLHAWVKDGEEGVVGYRATQKERYHLVARYPTIEQTTV